MRAARRLLVPAGIGAVFGALDSAANAVSSPYTSIGSSAEGTGWAGVAKVLGFLVDAGWAWAAVGLTAGWLAGERLRGAVAGGVALLVATTAYYGTDSWLRGETFSRYWPEIARWWIAAVVLGAILGGVGAVIRHPGIVGLLAGLVVPVGAALEMVLMPPGFGGRPVPVEAVCARWIVWAAAAVTAALVVVRATRVRRATQPASR
jgi:hypothetical protein